MDGPRFDAVARTLGSVADRRATVRALTGAALGALTLRTNATDAKKNKKKCKQPKVKCGKKCCPAGQKCIAGACAAPCTFSTVGSVMTLLASCATTTDIEVPNGFTLDGNNKTIRLAGPIPGFGPAVWAKAGQATVKNLAMVGGGLAFRETGGAITDVSVSGSAVSIHGTGGQQVSLTRVSVKRPGGGGMFIWGPPPPARFQAGPIRFQATIDDCDIEDAHVGIGVFYADAAITNTRILRTAQIGVQFDSAASGYVSGSVDGSRIEAGLIGVSVTGVATVDVTDNTIVGPGAATSSSGGVIYDAYSLTAATVAGNAISGFFEPDPDPLAVACGIRVEEDSTVVIGANTFPDPPGNEQDVCDFRP